MAFSIRLPSFLSPHLLHSPDGIRSPSQSGHPPTKTCHETGAEEMGTTLRPGSPTPRWVKSAVCLAQRRPCAFCGRFDFWAWARWAFGERFWCVLEGWWRQRSLVGPPVWGDTSGGSGTSPSRSTQAVEMRHALRARASTALSQAVSPRDSALSCSLPLFLLLIFPLLFLSSLCTSSQNAHYRSLSNITRMV